MSLTARFRRLDNRLLGEPKPHVSRLERYWERPWGWAVPGGAPWKLGRRDGGRETYAGSWLVWGVWGKVTYDRGRARTIAEQQAGSGPHGVGARLDTPSDPASFFAATADEARRVLDAEEGWPTYHAGLAFQGLAMSVMSPEAPDRYPGEEPMALYLIWGSLTDEMDAPGRGLPEQDAAAVRHMKRAAAEWLSVVHAPQERVAYCDRWVYEECGYERKPTT